MLFIWCALILAWAIRSTGSSNPQATKGEASNELGPREALPEWRDPYDLPIVG
ncbi:MAG: hypothetical protein M3022_17460 [Actinomycetota bacterium]|nr:hypothetical protein [Actinomycetota bacterium]